MYGRSGDTPLPDGFTMPAWMQSLPAAAWTDGLVAQPHGAHSLDHLGLLLDLVEPVCTTDVVRELDGWAYPGSWESDSVAGAMAMTSTSSGATESSSDDDNHHHHHHHHRHHHRHHRTTANDDRSTRHGAHGATGSTTTVTCMPPPLPTSTAIGGHAFDPPPSSASPVSTSESASTSPWLITSNPEPTSGPGASSAASIMRRQSIEALLPMSTASRLDVAHVLAMACGNDRHHHTHLSAAPWCETVVGSPMLVCGSQATAVDSAVVVAGEEGQVIAARALPTGPVWDLDWITPSLIVIASGESLVYVSMETLQDVNIPIKATFQHLDHIRELAVPREPGPHVLTASFDGTVMLHDVPRAHHVQHHAMRRRFCGDRCVMSSVEWNPWHPALASATADIGDFYLFDTRAPFTNTMCPSVTLPSKLFCHTYGRADHDVWFGFGDGWLRRADTRMFTSRGRGSQAESETGIVWQGQDPHVQRIGQVTFQATTRRLTCAGEPTFSEWQWDESMETVTVTSSSPLHSHERGYCVNVTHRVGNNHLVITDSYVSSGSCSLSRSQSDTF